MPACPICGKDNPAGFEFCGFCRASMARAVGRAEERKLVTMLFADLIGSTELGSRLDPERLRSILQPYFSAMATAVESWGGTVQKYIGDAVMAVFGVPTLREDDAERAVRAAIEMLERLEALNRGFERRHGVTLRVRVGVNTGEVIAPVGALLGQLIVAGDAVNVAARLEQAARPGTILVGERTHMATRGAFRFQGPVALELKGKAEVIRGYEVLGPEPGMEGARGSSGLSSELVGRDGEVRSLLSSLEEVIATGRGRMVAVYGPAGVGKSRLLREFVAQAGAAWPDLSVYPGRCLAAGHGITYWPLAEVMRTAFGVSLDDPSDVANDKLVRGASEALGGLDLPAEDVWLTTCALATTAGFSLEGNPLDRMEPREVAEQLARAWPRLATALAVRGPVLWICEDLHWAGDQLLEMLERLAARSIGPVLLVVTARLEFSRGHPAFGAASDIRSSISLQALTGGESEELVGKLLSESEMPSAFRAEILEKAEGNPLFIEEMLGRLIDEGALVREGDRWKATTAAAAATPLPDTVHALLAARIDALPRDEKRVLQEASVVGRTFWKEPVTRAVGGGEVSRALLDLERKGFLQASSASSIAGHAEFQIKHALIRDVAYASLPKARRARAHAEHAEWIETLAGDRSEEFAELIAYHYAAAVTDEADLAWPDQPGELEAIERRAFDALLVAGTLARRRYALQRAVELHAQAASLARTGPDHASALEALGDDHNTAIHGDAAVSAYRDAISILREEPGGDEDRGRICMKAARMILEKSGAFSVRQDPHLIDELVTEGRACASDEDVLAWLGGLWGATAVWWLDTGADPVALDERIRALTGVLADARVDRSPELEVFASEYLCELSLIDGSYARVIDLSRRTEVIDRIASSSGRALSLMEAGIWTLDVAGEAQRALQLGMRSYELAKDLSPHDLMHTTGFVIAVLYQLGRWSELDGILAEHVEAFMEEADATCEMLHSGVLAGATSLAHRGDLPRAQELVALAPPFVSTDPLWSGYADAWRARLQVAVGDPLSGRRQAEAMYGSLPPWRRFHAALVMIDALTVLGDRDALAGLLPTARAMSGGMAVLSPACDRADGSLASASGDALAARQFFASAIEGFERLGVPFEAARTREALASESRPDVAVALLESALAGYERLGAAPSAERAREALDRLGRAFEGFSRPG